MDFTSEEGRDRTESLYRSEPNTLCFKAYFNLILQGFKPFLDRPFIARSLPGYRPVSSPGEELGETFLRAFVSNLSVPNAHN